MRRMFSKEQLESLIKSGVETGATKLYLHEITDSESNEFVAISTYKEPFTEWSDIVSSAISIRLASGESLLFEDSESAYVISAGSLSGITLGDITEDEVTPL